MAALDSEPVELPLDYMQGHKDGLEWAARLAEANHPETGDWLYDDPIELAKAIRKGPDMPPVQPVADSEPVAWTWQHLKQWHVTNDEERARDLAWDGVKVEPLYRRAAMLQAGTLINEGTTQTGNSLAIPDGWTGNDKANAALMMLDRIETADPVDDDRIDGIKRIVRELVAATQPQNAPQNIPEIIPGWIPVSERMPEDEQEVLTINRMGHRFVSFFDKHSGLFFDRLDAPAACCIEHVLVTHWMPLPAVPQEVNRE
ncbi:DUF551 domain-containing protein [Klebsiella pneumoniae]|uniref:DUF551 domain-containing protein n=1 Tax=Klebsiella pneumoniae TaxID=573 RepID=UPI004067FC6B